MFGRKSRTAVLEHELSAAGSKAVDTIGDIAERALAVAREAGHHATPALQRAAESLAEATEKLADTEAAHQARARIADASERLAETIRPKPKRHRVRNLLIAAAVVGGVVALVQSPLRGKITERLFGPPPEEEPDSIELPGSEPYSEASTQDTEQFSEPTTPTTQAEGNGVASAPSGIETGGQG
jgi:hypothetical protein